MINAVFMLVYAYDEKPCSSPTSRRCSDRIAHIMDRASNYTSLGGVSGKAQKTSHIFLTTRNMGTIPPPVPIELSNVGEMPFGE